jgi:hypothetical protein
MFPLAVSQAEGSGSSGTTSNALYLPLGAVSPLWPVFAGAVGAGLAYWWMTRWPAATHLEALLSRAAAEFPPAPEAKPTAPQPAAAAEAAADATKAMNALAAEAVEPAETPVTTASKPLRPRPPRPPEG